MWDKERKKLIFLSFCSQNLTEGWCTRLGTVFMPARSRNAFNSRKSRKKTSFALTIAKLAELRAENKKSKLSLCSHVQKNVIKTSLYFSLKDKIFSIKAGYWASFKEQNYLKRVKNLSVFPGGATSSKFLQTCLQFTFQNPTWGTFPAVFEAPP